MNVIDAYQSHWSDILHRGGPEDNGSEMIPVEPDLDNASVGSTTFFIPLSYAQKLYRESSLLDWDAAARF